MPLERSSRPPERKYRAIRVDISMLNRRNYRFHAASRILLSVAKFAAVVVVFSGLAVLRNFVFLCVLIFVDSRHDRKKGLLYDGLNIGDC